jgi:hypothetical protein
MAERPAAPGRVITSGPVKEFRRDMMQERGEHDPFVSHRCLTYAAQRLEHAPCRATTPSNGHLVALLWPQG